MNVILFDNAFRNNLLPFTFTRPIAEIRVGISTIREKWEKAMKTECSHFTQDYLSELFPFEIAEDNLFIAGNLIPNKQLVDAIYKLKIGQALKDEENVLALRAGSIEHFTDLEKFKVVSYKEKKIEITQKHHIFQNNDEVLRNDFLLLTKDNKSEKLSESNILIGDDSQLFIEEGASIEGAILNCKTGPIYIGKNATIMEGAQIRGPFAMLENSEVKMGAKIYGATTIGNNCKVGGELNNVVIFGYSNKAHDGFLGNAVIGEWCNIGAGTDASNLKNNYAEIAQWNYVTNSYENTKTQFCGLMMGDHSKCGIGTIFNTGTVVGVGCNLYGADFHRSFIPSFKLGNRNSGYIDYSIEKVIESEKAMFQRRNLEMCEEYEKMLRDLNGLANDK